MRLCMRSLRTSFGFLFFIPIFAATPSQAQGAASSDAMAQTLTVDEAVRRISAHPDIRRIYDARTRAAKSQEAAAGTWDNPEITFTRESIPSVVDSREDYLVLSQKLDLSGRRWLRQDAAEERTRAEELRVLADLRILQNDVQADFYAALYRQQRVKILEAYGAKLGRIRDAVDRREQAGDVSGYDSMRVAQELDSIYRKAAREQAAWNEARRRLAVLLGPPPGETGGWQVIGVLAPEEITGQADLQYVESPHAKALRAEANAADIASRAAGRWWIPRLTLAGGGKRILFDGQSETGYLASLGVEIPLFDREQADRLASNAQQDIANARASLEKRAFEAALAARTGNFARLMDELQRNADATGRLDALLQSAEAAYAAGEFSVVELLDAYRTVFGSQLELRELEWDARQAWLSLNRLASGEASFKETE